MTHITVIDALMGSGKTGWAANLMATGATDFQRSFEGAASFLYIAPRLEDGQDVRERCLAVNPDFDMQFPERVDGSKMNHLLGLMNAAANIASTHALFKLVNADMLEVLKEQDYCLIVDEETEWVHEYDIRKDDARALFEAGFVKCDDLRRVRWNYERWPKYDGTKFAEVKQLCDNGNLVYVDDTFLIWEMPIAFLEAFKHIYIMTYLFEGSVLSAYFKVQGVPYETKTLDGNRNLVDFDGGRARHRKQALQGLINVCEVPSLNEIGTAKRREQPLSATWMKRGMDYKDTDDRLQRLRMATYNYFKYHCKGAANENMWATFNDARSMLKGGGYSKGFTAVNLRATNQYEHKQNLAYLANVFMRPRLIQYFESCGVVPDQDLYALSQLVQWVWRSRIRRKTPEAVNLFLPSQRMRELFKAWLRDEFRHGLKEVTPPEVVVFKQVLHG